VLNLVSEAQTVKEYEQYTYRRSAPFTVLNGIESGLAKKVLRYLNTDLVQVFVDGVKRNQGSGTTDYMLYDGVNAVPPNTVIFNSQIAGDNTQIDVIVTQASANSTFSITLTRVIDDESRPAGAWEGLSGVKIRGAQYSLFYADISELSNPPVQVKLRFNTSTPSFIQGNSTTQLDLANAKILLSRTEVYTSVDRVRTAWVPCSNLIQNYLTLNLVQGVRKLLVQSTAIENVFPPIEVSNFDTPVLISTGLTGNSGSIQPPNTLLNGPA
jgi:hypothetical protein